jgi:hypothetical protein
MRVLSFLLVPLLVVIVSASTADAGRPALTGSEWLRRA